MRSKTQRSVAEILEEGNLASDQISAARMRASTAWEKWRSYGKTMTKDGLHVTSTAVMPSQRVPKPGPHETGVMPVMIEQQLEITDPEILRLQKDAEEADKEVVRLQRAITLMQQVSK
jgi:hypothetical protein